MTVLSKVRSATRQLSREVSELDFGAPVTHVYNPLDYAAKPHGDYLARFAKNRKRVVFLGMNPGPYGMAQTGVPFGHVELVRDWLEIHRKVEPPANEHPKRRIQGFECTRSEVSGERVWGAISKEFGTPERFFARNFVANYCPLVFMEESGRNFTPDKLRADERDPLFEVCDAYLVRLVAALDPEWVIGIGAFATKRAELALVSLAPSDLSIGRILHPSPANPKANRGWLREVRKELRAQGVCDRDGLG